MLTDPKQGVSANFFALSDEAESSPTPYHVGSRNKFLRSLPEEAKASPTPTIGVGANLFAPKEIDNGTAATLHN